MTEAAVDSAYAQLASVGVVWIAIHCSGMCGPIVTGLDVAGAARGLGVGRGALAILAYQGGKGLTYATLGAVAGLVGYGLEAALGPLGSVFALAFGAAVLVGALWRRRRRAGTRLPVTRLEVRSGARRAPLWERAAARLRRIVGPGGERNPFLLGAVMGLLPCMITFWALGLAASTGSPLAGAGLMIAFAAMTTPMLLVVSLLPRLWRRGGASGRRRLLRPLLVVSGAWMVLVGLAGLSVVPHAHLPLALFGDHFVVMLW